VNDEEEFEIDEILKKKLVQQREEFKKKYLIKWVDYICHKFVSRVCNKTDTWLIISKYKKNTMKRKRRALYKSE